jgi:hypothetical protein
MVHQRFKQPVFVLCTLLLIALFSSVFYRSGDYGTTGLDISFLEDDENNHAGGALPWEIADGIQQEQSYPGGANDSNHNEDHTENYDVYPTEEDSSDAIEYREIFSATTWDRKFVPIFYQGVNVINPNIIPHPTEYYQWIVVAQHEQADANVDTEEQVACTAVFYEGTLLCISGTSTLSIQPSIQGNCQGESAELSPHFGPRNTRVFHGPDAPYVLYGSQSQYGCLGVWIQDARKLIEAFNFESFVGPQIFLNATEIRRSDSHRRVEKNFFLFWDKEGRAYIHHDLFPQRSFGELESDGTVAADIAPLSATSDQICYAKYMPRVALGEESLQQATNSLSVTLCRRSDADCIQDDSNTFIMHLFYIKEVYNGHVSHEPYMILFQRTPPFAIKAISQRPIWIHGRQVLGSPGDEVGRTERFYINSMNWKSHTQKYHGYIDDMLFLGFGIEDSHPGAMDVMAGDLLQDLAFCYIDR